jgi:hypothetical protein
MGSPDDQRSPDWALFDEMLGRVSSLEHNDDSPKHGKIP